MRWYVVSGPTEKRSGGSHVAEAIGISRMCRLVQNVSDQMREVVELERLLHEVHRMLTMIM